MSLRAPSIYVGCSLALGCASTAAHEHAGHLRLETPQNGLVDLPLEGHVGVGTGGRRLGVGELCPEAMALMSSPAIYDGATGAPVLVDGEIVGAAAPKGPPLGQGRSFQYYGIAEMEDWVDLAREATPDTGAWPRLPAGGPTCIPGSLVQAASYWGDLVGGHVGTVTQVRDGWISMFADDVWPTGTRYALLLDVTPLAVEWTATGPHNRHTVVSGTGMPVGCTVFGSPVGPIGRAGILPPHFRVDFVFVGQSGRAARKAVDFAANGDLGSEEENVIRALAPLVRRGNRVTVATSEEQSPSYGWLRGDALPAELVILWEGADFTAGLQHLFQNAEAGAHYRLCSTP